ncbi:MAG TPA: radical SAM protein [Candidatus Acidoferrales bacterium]|nr:radical SAM protein [Candidatus Acidoferrales bacterium]
MADVLLTHSYHLPYDRKQVRKQQPYPPLGTLYAAALLRENGISTAVFDTMLNDPEDGFQEALRAHRPKIVAIYEDDFNFLSKMCLTKMRAVALRMLAEAQRTGTRVIAHGSDATDHAAEYLDWGFDFVLIGSAEQTLLSLVQGLLSGADASDIPGAISRSHRGGRRTGRAAGHGAGNAPLPLPARDLIDIEQYRRAWRSAHGTFSLNMVASRGCPFHCNWCAKPIFGDSYRVRSAADVAEEMRLLKEVHGAEHIWFADDIFALNRHWVRELAEEVEVRNCAVPFKVQARADLISAETAQCLRRAGCAEVWMGVESGSQKILDLMDKGLEVEDVISAGENLKREGIRSCYFLQFGYPGENYEDLQKTIALVRHTRPDDIGVSFSYPLPNTKFHELVRQELGSKLNWSDSEDLCVIFKGAYSDEFYRVIRDALHAEVNGWHGDARSSIEAAALWSRAERMEPASRNHDATVLSSRNHGSGRNARHSTGHGLIRPADLLAPLGEL